MTLAKTLRVMSSSVGPSPPVEMITSERLADARAIWEAALQRHRESAPLRFNLGAVCEAAGDLRAARAYFQSAVKADKKYSREFDLFQKRNESRRP